MRKALGISLVFLLVLALLPSFLKPDALAFLPWLDLAKDWKVMLTPIILISVLLLLPILRRVSVKGMEFDISQPEPELARLDLSTTLKAFVEASSTSFPQLGSQIERPDVAKAFEGYRNATLTGEHLALESNAAIRLGFAWPILTPRQLSPFLICRSRFTMSAGDQNKHG